MIEVKGLTLGGDVFLSKKDNHIWALTATFNSFIFVFLFGIRRCVKVFSSILGHTYIHNDHVRKAEVSLKLEA